MQSKKEKYNLLNSQLQALINGESDEVAIMANTAALIHNSFNFLWTGFYRVINNGLVLGPFQGEIACTHIGYGRGVCGTSWKEKRTIVVPDVEQFPGHIACSSKSRSEIVVPLIIYVVVHAVLDIDSDRYNTFDDADRKGLEQTAAILSDKLRGNEREIYYAAGCFWGAQHYLGLISGVVFTEVGFANGNAEIAEPTYEMVYTDKTGYAETVRVRYDTSRISLRQLTELYFKCIDPTSLNKQGEDHGTRYRTGIYYTDYNDRATLEKALATEASKHERPIQVELEALRNFYPADASHQHYLTKNPDGYCHIPQALFDFVNGKKTQK